MYYVSPSDIAVAVGVSDIVVGTYANITLLNNNPNDFVVDIAAIIVLYLN